MPRAWDRHHVLYPRADYRTPHELALRRHPLLIPRMDMDVHHNGLHPNVQPPLKPHHGMIIGALALLHEIPRQTPHPEAIDWAANYFDRMEGPDAILGHRIALNLYAQLTYIEDGYVRDTE